MPSKSKAQHNFMEAIAHSPSFAKKAGVPMSVGKDFATADKGKKFSKGGDMAKSDMKEDMKADLKQDKAMMQKAVNKHESRLHKGASMTKLAKGGTFRSAANGIAQRGKTKGTQIKMNKGGMPC
jgi:hypothetical protein|tara:strand:- start:5 stop:376 length:372 start_codon:yes stop_codon:yes gene_type:complete